MIIKLPAQRETVSCLTKPFKSSLCTDKVMDEVDVPYSIQGYIVCLASGDCNVDATDTAALGSFVSMMKIQTKFSTTMACEVSGAGLLTMGVVMALTF